MARRNTTLPIRFFKIILQTNLQRIQIPNNFTRRHGVGLSNPVLIKPPDGTKWKVYWKEINGEIWFEKGWKFFTQNYSLGHGCLVIFKYKGTSKFDVLILGQNALEIDYFSCDSDTYDDKENVCHSDNESLEILDEWPNQKSTKKRSPLFYPRPHKKVKGGIKESSRRTTSWNWPKGARAQEIALKFISSNPFFTILINPTHLVENRMYVPTLNGVIENKEKYIMLQIGKKSWNLKLLPCCEAKNGRRLSAGWPLFASESQKVDCNREMFVSLN